MHFCCKMSFSLADVENEYKKDPELKEEEVKALLEWVEKQPHLPKITELQASLFLHSCYYKIEAAKIAIDNYFTTRTLYPDIFECPTEDVLKRTLSTGFIRIFPKQTPDGYDILVMKLIDCRPKSYECVNLIKLMSMVSTLHIHQHGNANGLTVIFDMEGSTLGHVTRINLTALRQFFHHVQEGMPIRIKGLHIINVLPLTDKLLALMKPFMKKELADIINLHPSSIQTLYKHIPKSCLPTDYGGELPSIQILQEENVRNLLENLDFFKWHDTQKVEESKRSGIGKNANKMFGMEGTFKTLQID